ncbi:MAG: AAA family ATPase [Roseinatronobacter sp.]|nr:AAA family ATPase [Roseinatronobacter sp.]
MRLNQLGLLRYGHFTNHLLEFPRPAPGTPDLHVIYGPNEAGKSTLFSGWRDLLFGIPVRTGYNFLHDNRALRLGASLDTPHGPLAVARVKGNANTLLDTATGSPLPDASLAAALGGLDRDGYMTMFSLDDETLELGGKSILDSKGELGSLLFAASAGLAELSAGLSALHDDSAQWFRPKGRAHVLAGHKARLAELTSQRKAADLAVSDWRRLVQAVEQAQEGYETARARRAETQARLDALRRDLDALPMLSRLRKDDARLAALPAPRPVAPDWPASLPTWLAQEAELAALIPAAQDQLASLEAALANLPPDDAATAHIPRLEAFEGRFGAVTKERADLPRRRAELAEIDRAQTAALARLGRSDLTVASAAIAPISPPNWPR